MATKALIGSHTAIALPPSELAAVACTGLPELCAGGAQVHTSTHCSAPATRPGRPASCTARPARRSASTQQVVSRWAQCGAEDVARQDDQSGPSRLPGYPQLSSAGHSARLGPAVGGLVVGEVNGALGGRRKQVGQHGQADQAERTHQVACARAQGPLSRCWAQVQNCKWSGTLQAPPLPAECHCWSIHPAGDGARVWACSRASAAPP